MFTRKTTFAALPLLVLLCLTWASAQVPPNQPSRSPDRADEEGNWREDYDGLRQGLLDKATPAHRRGGDLREAVKNLTRLNRVNEADAFIESVVDTYPNDGTVLHQAALAYLYLPRYGAMVAGEFRRGNARGAAKMVNSFDRDRVRAIQLLVRSANTPNPPDRGAAWRDLADALQGRRFRTQAWQLQLLTDLGELPDFNDGWSPGRSASGASVDEQGDPLYYSLPDSWDAAQNDGQRWRWALKQFASAGNYEKFQAKLRRASFLLDQFGVQSLAEIGPMLARHAEDAAGDPNSETGTFALHTLKENETIARLATGVSRFNLPDDQNHIKLLQEVVNLAQQDDATRHQAVEAATRLADIFKNRRQYPRAAEYYRQAIKLSRSKNQKDGFERQLKQIVGVWGQFGHASTQPAGQGAEIDFRFRNGQSVEFVARRVKVQDLLKDVKQYLGSHPDKLEWQQLNVQDLGHRLIHQKEKQYLGEEAARWNLDLKPADNHFDRRINVTTPLVEPGAYWLTGTMKDGNTSHILLWVADTAIVRKPMDGKQLYFVGDARNGKPVAGATIELFGYRQFPTPGRANRYEIRTQHFAETTNANGMVQVEVSDKPEERSYQWLAIATTPDGRHAFMGFDGFGRSRFRRDRYNATKAYVITDRPVYRPGNNMHYKAWVQRAEYGGKEDASEFALKSFRVELIDGRGEKVQEVTLTANAYGAIEGEYELPSDATLGRYQVNVLGHGSGWFRVEEYKKPEFEVTVESPEDTLQLGDKFTATIQAKYYFGSPVVSATVKYKVTRTKRDAHWWPPRPWDWLYGPGYWWYGQDYDWYPGFRSWGCRCPVPPWWGWRQPDPPEIVAEGEAPIGADGRLEIPIDTALAKELHGDSDHNYHVEAQVVDESRRTIVGTGDVLVAQQPFRCYVWTQGGFYRQGDTVEVGVATRAADGKPLAKTGRLRLLKLTYPGDGKPPQETEVREWELATDARGQANLSIKASEPGQYRLSYTVQTDEGDKIEGGHVFTITGTGFDGSQFTFNDLELVPDKQEYQPGDKLRLQINTNRVGSAVLLFVRPEHGVYPEPQLVRLEGKSTVVEIEVAKSDMPNLLIEAATIGGARVHQVLKDIAVPPESKVLSVELVPDAEAYKPGQDATVKLRVTDADGKPVVGETALTIYDKSVEYISGGSNAGDIRKFFWDWRRTHHPQRADSLVRSGRNLVTQGDQGMQYLGVFGASVSDEFLSSETATLGGATRFARGGVAGAPMPMMAAPMAEMDAAVGVDMMYTMPGERNDKSVVGPQLVEPSVRTEFADTALWRGSLETDEAGLAEVSLAMPENLTTWKIMAWGVGHGARVGHGEAEVVTRKNLLVRLQTPRFLVERDEVILSANVHNYLSQAKQVTVRLELDGSSLEAPTQLEQVIEVPADSDRRVDWRVKAVREGQATVRALALTDEESDAMQLDFPVRVHGFEKMDSFSGVIAADGKRGAFEINVPNERRAEQTRLEVRYSPTLAGAMIDALPYLIDYPHGCTEQTLNRFLPAAITQQTLQRMGVDLAALAENRVNLNPQELGEVKERRDGWKRYERNPVYDTAEMDKVVKAGVRRLSDMQLTDGGWGWFSGYGEHSSPHTTATVVRGLIVARENGVAILPNVVDRGVDWLKNYQQEEIARLNRFERDEKDRDGKPFADNTDALVYATLIQAGQTSTPMREYLYRDRTRLAPYSLAMLGLALHQEGDQLDKRDMVIRNLKQFVVEDPENQTAYLNLPGGYWWRWYGSEFEAHAYFLKLLAATEPNSDLASGLVKYLLNNRKHASYWNSTRDTALVVEAMADYLAATEQDKPDMTVEVWIDGEKRKEVKITADNLFSFDNALVLQGEALAAGRHTVELRKSGEGRLYYNGYLTNFTLEDDIRRTGLEVRIRRDLYKLERVDATAQVAGSRGQAVGQAVEKYERKRITNLASVASGDLIEVELTLESKNDYEYLIITDHKAAGFEPVEVQSGYNGNEIGAYVEYRDEVVNLFARRLARGERSVSYRLRAEAPGQFSALPAEISAMYAPELRGNSDEIKVKVVEGGGPKAEGGE